MNHLNCLIIDDEPLAHKIILEYAKDIPSLHIVGQCYMATEALPILNNQKIDLIFLDINMPKIKGLDFLRILAQKPLVIITSAHQEYALESFELDVCDYLLKPFRFDRFLKAVHKAGEWQQLKKGNTDQTVTESSPANTTTDEDHLFIKSDKRFIQIRFSEIYYLESYGNYVKFWLEHQYHLTAQTLTGVEKQLPERQFFRIHKSYIVNKKHIDYVEGNRVVMRNGKKLIVGKNHRKSFKEFIS